MWRRQQGANGSTGSSGTNGKSGAAVQETMRGARALRTVDDLLRPADWDRLPDAERTRLVGGFAALAAPSAADMDTDAGPTQLGAQAGLDVQEWVARFVAPQLQRDLVNGVRHWLESAPADAHLFAGGPIASGRSSLVAALAREAMAKRPQPPEYCYVPDPASLDKPLVLALPRGTGAAFARSLGTALSALAKQWQAGSGATLAAQQLTPVETAAPPEARAYLAKLRAALEGYSGDDAPFDEDSMTVAHITPTPDDARSAPVVLASARTELSDALLRANGGVLVLSAASVDAGALTSALRSRALALKDGWPPIPLTVRVALVGTEEAYEGLWSEEMAAVFRYEAWGNDFTEWTREAEAAYATLADGVARRYGLPPFDPSGVARLVEEGARRGVSLNRNRLVTDLRLLHDLAFEAGSQASARGAAATSGAEVEAALLQRRRPHRVTARTVREAVLSGESMTPTSGTAVGQINGLGILEWHPPEAAFAVPMRISATASPGREEELIDVEREAEQADAEHVRGVMTVEGYLAQRYVQRPLAVAVRVRFEQEHGGTGGDSASTAILFALLSALAEVPIRRSLAITGAVGQYGEIQPIGGVNVKIEGFWELCRARRAAGEQVEGGYGVLIPATNIRDVMLRREVATSIASEGWFQVWAVGTVDDAIPLLMGISAQALHARVEQRLSRFAALARRQAAR